MNSTSLTREKRMNFPHYTSSQIKTIEFLFMPGIDRLKQLNQGHNTESWLKIILWSVTDFFKFLTFARTVNITEQLWWRIKLTQWQGQGKGNWHHPEVTFGSKVHCFLNYPASSAPVLPVCSTFVYCSSYGDVA